MLFMFDKIVRKKTFKKKQRKKCKRERKFNAIHLALKNSKWIEINQRKKPHDFSCNMAVQFRIARV